MLHATRAKRNWLSGLALGLLLSVSAVPGQAGSGWLLLDPEHNPGERADSMATFYPPTGQTILFGGQIPGGSLALGETWAWDGVDWSQIFTQGSPSPRSRAAMAYEPRSLRIILFGGVDETAGSLGGPHLYGDTWAFDGLRWALLNTPTSPPALVGAQMAWDPVSERLILHGGGLSFEDNLSSETWAFNGFDWQQLAPIDDPGTLKDHRMVTDTKRNRIVLFGGIDTEVRFLSRTHSNRSWEWTGDSWLFQDRVLAPPARRSFGMVFDEIRGVTMVSYGGISLPNFGTKKFADSWVWDGSAWSNDIFLTEQAPRARDRMVLVANPISEEIMLYGGDVASPLPGQSTETWLLGGADVASADAFGSGCAGSAGTPSLAIVAGSRPILGRDMSLRISELPVTASVIGILGRSRDNWTVIPLPLRLDAIGMPGCELLVSPNWSTKPFPISQAGTADWGLSIPADNGLIGMNFYLQSFIVDPGGNDLGVTATGAIELRIGAR